MTQPAQSMYRWRNMNDEERSQFMSERFLRGRPIHSVPHIGSETTSCFLITAACFEHKHVIGLSSARMSEFEKKLIDAIREKCEKVFAWTVLPNHYHILVDTSNVHSLLKGLGQMHGRSSYYWNREDNSLGRQVWCNAAETYMKSLGHFYASWNYVLHNAVHHGYVKAWTDWPFSSARDFVESVGEERVKEIWETYPLRDYGNSWDPSNL